MKTYYAREFKVGETIIIRDTGKLATVVRVVGGRYVEYKEIASNTKRACIPAHGDIIKLKDNVN